MRVALSTDGSEEEGKELGLVAEPQRLRDLTVARLSSHHVLLQVGVFTLQLSSSDGFLQPRPSGSYGLGPARGWSCNRTACWVKRGGECRRVRRVR